jgi:hypothetical protein
MIPSRLNAAIPRADQVRRVAAAGWVLHLLEQGAFPGSNQSPGGAALGSANRRLPCTRSTIFEGGLCHHIRGWAMLRPAICSLQHEMAIACLAHTKSGFRSQKAAYCRKPKPPAVRSPPGGGTLVHPARQSPGSMSHGPPAPAHRIPRSPILHMHEYRFHTPQLENSPLLCKASA